VESALEAARAAVKGDDKDAISRAGDELQQASHAMAEALYKAESSQASAGGPDQSGAGVKDAEVVDAEFAETK
jgi:molecular chaperone DnaK